MPSYDPSEALRKLLLGDARRLLILAHSRLFLQPERSDGSKAVTVASFGTFEIRLTEVPVLQRDPVPPLWIELLDAEDQRVVDGAGYRTLHEASVAVECFFAAARRLSGVEDPE
jgi:hypothetical protein